MDFTICLIHWNVLQINPKHVLTVFVKFLVLWYSFCLYKVLNVTYTCLTTNMGPNFDMGLVKTLLALTKSQSKFDIRNFIRLPSPMGSRPN